MNILFISKYRGYNVRMKTDLKHEKPNKGAKQEKKPVNTYRDCFNSPKNYYLLKILSMCKRFF